MKAETYRLMIKQEFEKIVAALESTDMNNYPIRDPIVEQEIALLTKDISESIQFIKNDCTGRHKKNAPAGARVKNRRKGIAARLSDVQRLSGQHERHPA